MKNVTTAPARHTDRAKSGKYSEISPLSIMVAIILVILLISLGTQNISARALYDRDASSGDVLAKPGSVGTPNFSLELHKINELLLTISNGGTFGSEGPNAYIDPETGMVAPSCEYPAGSDISYLFIGAFWAGGIVGRDTLVSVGFDGNRYLREFWPPAGDAGAIRRRSSMRTSLDYSPDAVSEQDFVCVYSDTLVSTGYTAFDPIEDRPHIPLGLEVHQRSYGWSYEYAEDFIIFDFTVRNINRFPLKQVYFGIYVDADIYHESAEASGWSDDICGYLHDIPSKDTPGFRDTVRVAWAADNDGDPNFSAPNGFDYKSPTGVTGTAVLRTPNPDLKYSYNWWIANGNPAMDWGPRKAGTEEKPFRNFGYGLGSPEGDRNKYYMMQSQEFDYDQLESAVSHTDQGWLPPPRSADVFARGFDARYLFSFGPFDLQPGDTLPITLAYVAGAGFHVNGRDFTDYWDASDPYKYESRLDYSDLGNNAKWANWIFDNPGVDTDGDGDSGSCRIIIDTVAGSGPNDNLPYHVDTTYFWYRGDGVPDFRGASPPPAPLVKVTPEFGRLRVRWNGQISEENVDFFSGLKDFEGYRVYYAEDNRQSDYVMLSSYDIDDYNVYHFDAVTRRWDISLAPITGDSLHAWLGPDFDPEAYDRPEASYFHGGEAYYFTKQDWNRSDLSNPLAIHRVYPDADPNDPTDTTDEGFQRCYEYEYVIDGIQPSKPYYVSVTTFDYGSRKIALSSLESSPNLNAVSAYALPASDEVEERGLSVMVYPNPYRIDGGYARAGYENRDRTKSAERARSIHFYNLPKICTIRIYTLSGDLVEQIEHYNPGGGPESQHERWNMISRNTQAVVTGIYIYHVASDMGEQLGKIVIIK